MRGRFLGVSALLAFALANAPAAEPTVAHGGTSYVKLGFDTLASFPFTPPFEGRATDPKSMAAAVEARIPPSIKARHGQKVAITGYVVPVKSEKGQVTEIMLIRTTWAALNVGPFMMNEWVAVKIQPGMPVQTQQAVTFFGTLRVGAFFERGYLTGIYELSADRMVETAFP